MTTFFSPCRPWPNAKFHAIYRRDQDCYFALALQEFLPIGEMVSLGMFGDFGAHHVGLRFGSLYLDIQGEWEEPDFRHGFTLKPASLERVLLHVGLIGQGAPGRSPEMAAARKVARAMQADLGLSKSVRPRAAPLARIA